MSILKRKEQNQTEPKQERKSIAHAIAMREMADVSTYIKNLKRSEEQKKESCGRA